MRYIVHQFDRAQNLRRIPFRCRAQEIGGIKQNPDKQPGGTGISPTGKKRLAELSNLIYKYDFA